MEDIGLLEKVSFLKDLTRRELLSIAGLATTSSCETGQKVFVEGTVSDAFYIVKTGSVMVKNKNIVVATLETGAPIGEMSFIDSGPRSATVTAIEHTELMKVAFDDFNKLLLDEPQMAAKIYKAIAITLSLRLRELGEIINTRFQPVKF